MIEIPLGSAPSSDDIAFRNSSGYAPDTFMRTHTPCHIATFAVIGTIEWSVETGWEV